MSGSPAIDAGQNCVLDLTCATNNPPAPVTSDQRGVTRPGNGVVDIGSVEIAAPTSGSVSGRVVNQGSPVPNSLVTITENTPMGAAPLQTVAVNHFGYFRFTDIPAPGNYTLTVFSKQYVFCPVVINVTGDISGITLEPDGLNSVTFGYGKEMSSVGCVSRTLKTTRTDIVKPFKN